MYLECMVNRTLLMVEMTWKNGHMLNTLNVWQIILVDWIVIKRSSTALPSLLLMFFHCWFHWDFCFHVSSHVLHPHLYNYYYISHSYPSAIYMSNPYLYTPIVWHMYPNYALKGILWANLPIMKAHPPSQFMRFTMSPSSTCKEQTFTMYCI